MGSKLAPILLIGGGAITAGAFWYAARKSKATTTAIEDAVSGNAPPGGSTVKLRLTGYWPFVSGLNATERKMEGGVNDRKGKPLYSLEQHLSDPVKYPYVSLSGDDSIWPYGQRIIIDAWPKAVCRVVDTGAHFRGAGKVFRVVGEEPIDVCVDSSKTVVPKNVTGRIVAGDNFAKGATVATSKFKDQMVAGLNEGRTTDDYEALSRAVESELGGRPQEEVLAAAWTLRNRADEIGTSIYQMLAPRGVYGAPGKSGGYASTRRVPTEKSQVIAGTVIDAPKEADPTDGATDFWVPQQQSKMRELGDAYRAAVKSGDRAKAKRYARYANYGTEGDVRVKQAREGLRVTRVVGVVELLGKV